MRDPLLDAIFGFNAHKLRLLTAIRCTLGLCLPVLGFWYLGHLNWGILAGLGAIYGGLASFRGIYQERVRQVVATTFLMAIVTVIGNLVSPNAYACIAAVTVIGFILSLYAAMRPAASQLTTLATGTLVILSKLLNGPGNEWNMAIGNAAIIMAGGASQLLMLSIFAPFAQYFPERNAVGNAYDSLSNFAGNLARGERLQMLEGTALQEARDVLDALDDYTMTREQAALRRALSAAEGIRASLVGLSFASDDMRPKMAPFLFFLQARLSDIGKAARQSHLIDLAPSVEVELPTGLNEHVAQSLSVIDAILDHLRDPSPDPGERSRPKRLWFQRLSPRLLALASSVSLRSIAVRHALRYSLTLFVAMSFSRFGPFSNGYWIPLTACMVIKPDYASTLTFGVARAVGSVAGVLVALGIAAAFHPSLGAHVALVVASTFGFSLFFMANYTLFTALVTIWVIFSVSASGVAESLIGFQRLEASMVGIVLAVVIYLVVPDWQSSRVRDVLRDATNAQVDFCDKVLLATSLPESTEWERLLDRARALRYEAESVVEAALLEPTWSRTTKLTPAKQILGQLEMTAALLLALHAQRLGEPTLTQPFIDQVDSVRERATEQLALL